MSGVGSSRCSARLQPCARRPAAGRTRHPAATRCRRTGPRITDAGGEAGRQAAGHEIERQRTQRRERSPVPGPRPGRTARTAARTRRSRRRGPGSDRTGRTATWLRQVSQVSHRPAAARPKSRLTTVATAISDAPDLLAARATARRVPSRVTNVGRRSPMLERARRTLTPNQATAAAKATTNSSALRRPDGREHLLVADLAEPEPVRVEADELADRRAAAARRPRNRSGVTSRHRHLMLTAPERARTRRSRSACWLIEDRTESRRASDAGDERRCASGPQLRIQLRSAQSWQTSIDRLRSPAAPSTSRCDGCQTRART